MGLTVEGGRKHAMNIAEKSEKSPRVAIPYETMSLSSKYVFSFTNICSQVRQVPRYGRPIDVLSRSEMIRNGRVSAISTFFSETTRFDSKVFSNCLFLSGEAVL